MHLCLCIHTCTYVCMCLAVLGGKFSEVPSLGKMRLGHALINCLDQAFYINSVSMHAMFHAEN